MNPQFASTRLAPSPTGSLHLGHARTFLVTWWLARSMGARIILCDPYRCVVQGPTQLYAEKLESPDIRAGMALVLAALSAQGRSVIRNVGQIDRGYERIEERLCALGAHIQRVRE